MVQDVGLKMGREDEQIVAIDVGANVGEWSRRLLTAAAERNLRIQVHAFEPSAATYEQLSHNLLPSFDGSAVPVHCAASDHSGTGTLFKVHELAGIQLDSRPGGLNRRDDARDDQSLHSG